MQQIVENWIGILEFRTKLKQNLQYFWGKSKHVMIQLNSLHQALGSNRKSNKQNRAYSVKWNF